MYGYYGYPLYDWRLNPPMTWSPSKVMLDRQLRALWEQHVYWTRLTVNSIIERLPDESVTTARLLRNAADFGAALEPIYGPAIAAAFAELLRGHLTIAAELVKALLAGNTAAAEDAQKRWYENADDIALFLSRINPYWSQAEWQKMMHEHLRLLTSEVSTKLMKNYEENVALGDQIEAQALEMADMMTTGIIQQFPARFNL
ncbi:acetylglutamate kinase [Paenibacillus xanthanilyticus]|uniref:Acetylglutamate kinase n=1 Tax=Paenibacillus xanthanilyticus TaxID=1783531 RepID=A0ABV8K261_9BACL